MKTGFAQRDESQWTTSMLQSNVHEQQQQFQYNWKWLTQLIHLLLLNSWWWWWWWCCRCSLDFWVTFLHFNCVLFYSSDPKTTQNMCRIIHLGNNDNDANRGNDNSNGKNSKGTQTIKRITKTKSPPSHLSPILSKYKLKSLCLFCFETSKFPITHLCHHTTFETSIQFNTNTNQSMHFRNSVNERTSGQTKPIELRYWEMTKYAIFLTL